MTASDLCARVSVAARSGLGEISCDEVAPGVVRLSTPFVGPGDETIAIWIQRTSAGLLLSDGGDTLFELGALGINAGRGSRRDFVAACLEAHGLTLVRDELHLEVHTEEDIERAVVGMVQAVADLGSLYYSARPQAPQKVVSKVAATLHTAEVSFERMFLVRGTSRLERRFDFRVLRAQESLIRTLATSDERRAQRSAELMAFHAEDIRGRFPDRFRFLLVYDDDRLTWPEGVYAELERFEVLTLPVSDPERLLQGVAA